MQKTIKFITFGHPPKKHDLVMSPMGFFCLNEGKGCDFLMGRCHIRSCPIQILSHTKWEMTILAGGGFNSCVFAPRNLGK